MRNDEIFTGMRRPTAPAALRRRALRAARAAASEAAPALRSLLADLLWESRPLRWTWATAVVLAVATNLLLLAVSSSTEGTEVNRRTLVEEPEIRYFLDRYRPASSGGHALAELGHDEEKLAMRIEG